ncbi:flavodoxin [Lactiplantibacillus paraplantarum]|uniref:flavodoxin n=1 Tax=Lactiplantibacillus paraplantarum TaxID=60520 RepID=UPI00068E4862|nr:hypothetical protein [Lactiplantibacillus paraplantarum]ALO03817.1 hypothetical protein ASU28_05360 [Lactiplantibacillus paraplantarum]OAX74081.1 hypothetical protein A0U96_07930 [Lactiplantibacillus plantarum]RDG11254.1 flavodoxin [Lactiplantibacillus paraplantarum]
MAKKQLVLDYSYSGTTAKLAEVLQEQLGAERIKLQVTPTTFPNDMFAVAAMATDQIEHDQLPALTNQLPDLMGFDELYIGGPVWSGTVATPVRKLLQQLGDYQGIIKPFYTSSGTPGGYEQDFKQLLPGISVNVGLGLTASQLSNQMTLNQQLLSWLKN